MKSEMEPYDILYMVRNFMTGDDEQTRIEDSEYWKMLPERFLSIMRELVEIGEYDTAIQIFVNQGIKKFGFKELVESIPHFVDEFTEDMGVHDDDIEDEKISLTTDVHNGLEKLSFR